METIKAPQGGWLTQAADTPPECRIMAKEITGRGAAEAYRQATQAEYQAWLAAQQPAETPGEEAAQP